MDDVITKLTELIHELAKKNGFEDDRIQAFRDDGGISIDIAHSRTTSFRAGERAIRGSPTCPGGG